LTARVKFFSKLKTEHDKTEQDRTRRPPDAAEKFFRVEPDARLHDFKNYAAGSYRKPRTLENTGFLKSNFAPFENPPRRISANQFSKFVLDIILIIARRPFMARAFVFSSTMMELHIG